MKHSINTYFRHSVRAFRRVVGVALVTLASLAGCIKPDMATETPSPGQPVNDAGAPAPAVITPSSPPPENAGPPAASTPAQAPAPQATWPQVEQFIQSRGDVPVNLAVWYDQPLSAVDRLQGFSYTNSTTGVPCTGFLLTGPVNGVIQPTGGQKVCATQPIIDALAAAWVVVTSDGQPVTVVFGRVELPNVAAIAVVYTDGTSLQVNPVLGGFLLAKPDLVGVTVITAIDAQGNTVIANIPQTPVS